MPRCAHTMRIGDGKGTVRCGDCGKVLPVAEWEGTDDKAQAERDAALTDEHARKGLFVTPAA